MALCTRSLRATTISAVSLAFTLASSHVSAEPFTILSHFDFIRPNITPVVEKPGTLPGIPEAAKSYTLDEFGAQAIGSPITFVYIETPLRFRLDVMALPGKGFFDFDEHTESSIRGKRYGLIIDETPNWQVSFSLTFNDLDPAATNNPDTVQMTGINVKHKTTNPDEDHGVAGTPIEYGAMPLIEVLLLDGKTFNMPFPFKCSQHASHRDCADGDPFGLKLDFLQKDDAGNALGAVTGLRVHIEGDHQPQKFIPEPSSLILFLTGLLAVITSHVVARCRLTAQLTG
jgi:hypothetical protein